MRALSWSSTSLRAAASLAALVAMGAGGAQASFGPPWLAEGAPALPTAVQSLRVMRADEPVFAAPHKGAARRGSVGLEIRLPIFGASLGTGCKGRWLEVGPLSWVCEDGAELSADTPLDAGIRLMPETEGGLPYRYFFVGPEGSFGYKQLRSADIGAPDVQLEPGFAVAVTQERTVDGAAYARTHAGLWVPARDLGPARPSAFRGVTIDDAARGLGFGWVIADKANVLDEPRTFARSRSSKARFEVVPILEQSKAPGASFFRIGEGAWIAARDVRQPTSAAPPTEVDVAAGERWIDVELASQTLVAFEGDKPVFATLVSTGKGRPGSATATPVGTHRIWVKLLTSHMDNLENEGASRYYRMEDVPYVQYFSKGVGLHGVFWHRSFGQVRSHGCVNLAPLDAQRLFSWTAPHLPSGWSAVSPTSYDRGTVVRVR